ncbi:DUF485 domain-containing protein [Alkalihalobacillus sp. 1P02AB]|uniref:DUF485 domain-containing protein n=1 Tax=Alkalihalobacillus sp. 1P02AB TaxID=3132260 RepID=UPI0039A78822
MDNLAKVSKDPKPNYNYQKMAKSTEFKGLIKAKKRFLIPTVLFFLVFYFTLPILTSFTTVLESPAIGAITWTWVYAFAQFIMTWVLCMLYVRKATKYDETAEEIVAKHTKQGDQPL